jgi:TadE-like protein
MPIRLGRRTRGQALVEFALVAPIFFLLLFSIIELGRAVYYIQMLNNAAREGARYAIVHGAESLCPSGPFPPSYSSTNPCDPTGDEVVKHAKTYAIGIIDAAANDFDVVVKWCDGDDTSPAGCPNTNAIAAGDGHNGRNQNVRVTVAYTFRPMVAGVVPLPSFTLTGGSTLVVNH